MEMTRAEIDAIYDAEGRLVVTPHALTTEGQRNVPADLRPCESLAAFLARHVDGIESGAWLVSISGAAVPRAMWAHTYPKHGQLIACRAVVRKAALQLVAIAALAYFSGGIAAGIYGAAGGTYVAASAGIMLSAIQMGVFVAGSMLINKVLGPKVSTPDAISQKTVYSLNSQRNTARPYEPIPVLWGEMRVTPDLASQAYAWFDGDDQYLSTILLGGINVHSVSDLSVGDTPLTSYSDVSVYYNGFPGMPNQDVPLYGNVDSVAGAEFVNGGDWITRTGSAGAIGLALDIEGQLYDVNGKGGIGPNWVDLTVQARLVGAADWTTLQAVTLNSSSTDTIRRTYSFDVAEGQYEVRAKLGVPRWNEGGSADACKFAWGTLRSIQRDSTDYSGWGRVGIKIKATGQLSGSLDTVRANYRAKPMPVWNGLEWVSAELRSNGLSNPGAIILQALRGVYAEDENGVQVLQFGLGMSDEQIDIEGLKAFMLHCAARGFCYDKWVTSSMSLGDFCQEVALAGMGEFAWTDGSRPTVMFVSSGQPTSAVVNMANMQKASFSVDYALSNTADGIEYQYLDRDTWETKTLRVMAPSVTKMLNPARVTGEGVGREAHAAVLARYHLAQSLYQFKTIAYSADIEHLDYRRLSIVSVSHDLTQWGYGGRLMNAEVVDGKVRLTLDEPVPPLDKAHVGLRIPGERDYRVWPVVALGTESDVVELVGEWPAGVAFPGAGLGNPAHDTLWCYDFKATPGYRVRVTSMEPEGDLKGAKITCVPEGPEFWDYVLNGNYVPAPNQSSIPQLGRPAAKNLRVTERINVQGDTEWYELSCIWDVEGEYDHAQVWAGRDGSELRLVDGNAMGSRSTFRIDGAGDWLIEVKPFNAGGQGGQSAVLLYITTQTQLPPRNVDQFVVQKLAGGLRRFAWQYTGDKPPAFAGVQIRYLPGDVALSTANWDAMQPLGDAGDIYSAQFETTKPQAGLWTFGCRAIDTAGQLSNGIMRFAIQLDESFEQVQQPDLTPPPEPTGLAADGGLSTVQVSWDVPLYTMGHGHARTDVWAGATPDRAAAKKVADGYAGPVSFTAEPSQTLYVWAQHVTVDGVSGPWAGPVQAQTGTDIEGLKEVLTGQLGTAQFDPIVKDRIDTIDLLDKDGGPLGRSMLDAIASHDTAEQLARMDMDDMADGLLQAALAADRALERITDAGVYVDPTTGMVKIYGLEQTKEHVTDLQILLDAVQGTLQLKATTAYVDGKIAEAVLSPADLLLYEGLDARIVSVTQTLDSINGTLAQKASALDVQNAVARITTAENSLNALTGQINLRVTRAEYEANRDLTETRLQSAELQIGALDLPSITATVQAFGRSQSDTDENALSILRGLLAQDQARTQSRVDLAFARTELSARIIDGLEAEAQQRTVLAAAIGAQTAALEQESRVLADALKAEASKRESVIATVDTKQQAAEDALAESLLRGLVSQDAGQQKASRDVALARTEINAVVQAGLSARATETKQLAAAMGDSLAAVQQQFDVQAGVNGYQAAQYSLSVQVGAGGQAVVGGMKVTGTSSDTAGSKIAVAFSTDIFLIAAPDGSKSSVPFYVQPQDQVINGQLVPAGVFMDSARIGNVEVIFGRFGTLFADKVQATAISASQLTAGNGVIGGTLKSSNYVAGSSGWTLRPDGVAEFSGVIVRGTVYATAGSIGGITIAGGGLNAGAYSGYGWPSGTGTGFHLGPNGLLLGNPSTGGWVEIQADGKRITMPGFSVINGAAKFSGQLEAAGGTFSGSLQAASGSFSGVLTADEVVTTKNLQTNAVSVVVYAQANWPVPGGASLWLSTPAFGPEMSCAIDFGVVLVPDLLMVRVYIDGAVAWETRIDFAIPGFNYSYLISGNGLGRAISVEFYSTKQTVARYLRATVFKR